MAKLRVRQHDIAAGAASLELNSVMASRVELGAVQAILGACVVRTAEGNVERGTVAAAAEITVGRIARCRQERERFAHLVEYIDAGLVACPRGGVDVAGGIECHSVDAASTAEIEEHAFAFERTV